MFTGYNGRSRPGVGMVRPHRPRTPAKPKASIKADDAEAKTPDPVEIRSLRAAYYDAAPNARKSVPTISNPTAESQDRSTSRVRKTGEEHRHRGRNHKSSSSRHEGNREVRRKSYSRRRTEEYVYGLSVGQGEGRKYGVEGDAPHHAERRRGSETTSSSRRNSLSTVAEDDIMPGDSVSQNGRRRAAKHERGSSTPRPPLSRSSTTPAGTPVISPDAVAKRIKAPTAVSPKAGKQSTSIFGALLRRHTTTSVPSPPRTVECLTCGSDDIPVTRSAKLECGHRMCNDCLKRLFQMSVKDPAHMPPKCCTDRHIPLKHVERLFDLKFKVLWNRKYQEYHTKNRIYCPIPKCGEWIKPANFRSLQGRKYAMCPKCKTKVCVLCNSRMHKSQECPKDPDIAKLVEQAKEEGWQTCFNCRAIVERKEGCNHMTCRCQAEFCILCGLKWKTCDCPWFNYNGTADPDQPNGINIPERIQVLFRRPRGAAVIGIAEPDPEQVPSPPRSPPAVAIQDEQPRNPTYTAELEQRRRQERLDAALARRMQLASILDPDESDERSTLQQQDSDAEDVSGARRRLTNNDFVHNAANVVMQAFGNGHFRQMREREVGRQRRTAPIRRNGGNADSALDSSDDESIIRAGPAPQTDDEPDEPERSESDDSDES